MTTPASPFTPDQQAVFDAEVKAILGKFPEDQKPAALIPILHVAQNLHGWLKPEAMDYCGHVVGVPPTRVREVVTFYTMFKLKPVGETHVGICVNIACWLEGSDKLVARCRERIGDRQHEPTADGKLSWAEVECLASCGTAPATLVNDQYAEHLTPEQLDRILDLAKKQKPTAEQLAPILGKNGQTFESK